MRLDSIFRLASVTKSITSALAMQLVEQGWINLGDPVTDYLPDFRPKLACGETPTITLRHLLTHTSGLGYRFAERPDGPYNRLKVSDGSDQPDLSLKENLQRLQQAPLYFAPGESWRYSLGIDVLGGVIEQALGQSLADAVEERITGPLAMTDTAFHAIDPARLTTPYADGDPEPVAMLDGIELPSVLPGFDGSSRFVPRRIHNPASYPSGGSGLAGTASDILRFFESIRLGGGPILKPTTAAEMKDPQVGADVPGLPPGLGFGYGWSILLDPAIAGSPQSPNTIEWGGAYGHRWFVDPARKLTVVALTNTAFEGVFGAFPFSLRDAVYRSLN